MIKLQTLLWILSLSFSPGCGATQEAPILGTSAQSENESKEEFSSCDELDVDEVFITILIEAYGQPNSCTNPLPPAPSGEVTRYESTAAWTQAFLSIKSLPPETIIKSLRFNEGYELTSDKVDTWLEKLISSQWKIDWSKDEDPRTEIERFYSSIENLNAIVTIVRSEDLRVKEIKFSAAL